MGVLNGFERTQRLMQAMGFTEEELAANRQGQLSPRQQANLKETGTKMRASAPRYTVMGGVVIVGLFIFFVVVGLTQFSSVAQALQVVPFLSIPILIILGAVAYQVYRYQRVVQQTSSGNAPVKRYSGKVKLVIVNYGMTLGGLASSAMGYDPRQYKLQIGGTTFYPPGPVFTAFQNGQKYNVYATRAAYYPQILSAEGID